MNKQKKLILGGLAAIGVAVLLAPLASSFPDGLEKTAETQGFAAKAGTFFSAVFADYTLPGLHSVAVSRVLAGLIGVAIVFVLVVGLAKLLSRKER